METLLEQEEVTGLKSLQKNTIMIVDDVEMNRSILRDTFEDTFDILEAADGETAFELVQENSHRLAVILLDVMMPKKDGFFVLHEMQKDKKLCEIPVVMVTSTEDTETFALKNGAWDFISKPFDMDIIKTRVENVIKRSNHADILSFQKEAYADQLTYLVEYDVLTGLYNDNCFINRTEMLLRNYRNIQFVICRMDINHFKIVNELFGREEGNRLLVYIADIIKQELGDEKYSAYGRANADVYYICMPYDESKVTGLIEKIEKKVADYPLDFEVVVSFGLYVIDDPDLEIGTIYDRANLALSSIKGNYLKRVAYYDEELHGRMLREQEIISQMRGALETGQFQVFLQPKCSLDTGGIVGAEALVRWFHPVQGSISPVEFIPIFERSGFITRLDYFVWEETCKTIRRWIDEGKEPIPVSVNISRIHLYNPDLSRIFLQLVDKYKLDPKLLELEITESVYSDSQNLLIQAMKVLQDEGFVVMMDDFGSGYSSLNMLKDAMVDMLKVDLNFLSGRDITGRGASILSSVIRMARWLDLPVIVEGVETREQIYFLRSIGCTVAQGYYFARPLAIPEFEKLYYEEGAGTQKEYLDKLENKPGIDKYWQDGQLESFWYDDIAGAVGLYEVSRGQLEAIRLSSDYFVMMDITRNEFYMQSNHLLDYIHQDDRTEVMTMFGNAFRSKGVDECVFRRKCKNGKVLWLEAKAKFLSGDEVRQLYFVTLHDITREKQIERKLESLSRSLEGRAEVTMDRYGAQGEFLAELLQGTEDGEGI